MALSVTGLEARAELLYRKLLQRTHWRTQELARAVKCPVGEVAQALQALSGDGLVGVSADDPTSFRAVEPCVALPALLARAMCEGRNLGLNPVEVDRFIALHELAAERDEGVARGRGGHRTDASSVVERMVAKAEEDVTFLVPGYVDGGFAFSRPSVDLGLRRGIRLRAVWASSVFDVDGAMDHALWLAQQDVPPRMADVVPVCAMIMDGAAAVVIDDSRTPRMVRSGAELESLCSLAERLWGRGAEVRRLRRTPGTGAAQPRMQMVLRLLADGLTDDAIARRLGCSVRTVRNDVAAAMAALDARSRFQAGARAMRAGLI
ncbi:helix-turn-helix domain-containing protein [Streptomyces sp. NPDC002225]|uniref:helix-turn-helix domain-containing protein n=1 Tax=Streptomyces sp. NPDC002225 TaxID=3154413 RepID=UPI0033229A83